MQRGFLVGAVGGVAAMAAAGGVLTHLLAGKDVQYTTIDPYPGQPHVKVGGHPAIENTVLESRIEGWYHPLPWVGEDIDEVSCPARLKAVAGATGTCTARAGGERVTIPVRVTKVAGDPATPRVTWRFER